MTPFSRQLSVVSWLIQNTRVSAVLVFSRQWCRLCRVRSDRDASFKQTLVWTTRVPCGSAGGPSGAGQLSPDAAPPRAAPSFVAPVLRPLAGGPHSHDDGHVLSPVSPPSKLLTPRIVPGPPDTGTCIKDKSVCLYTIKSNQIFKILLDKWAPNAYSTVYT